MALPMWFADERVLAYSTAPSVVGQSVEQYGPCNFVRSRVASHVDE